MQHTWEQEQDFTEFYKEQAVCIRWADSIVFQTATVLGFMNQKCRTYDAQSD